MRRIAASAPPGVLPPRPGGALGRLYGLRQPLAAPASAAGSRNAGLPIPLPLLPPNGGGGHPRQHHQRRRRRTAVVDAAPPFFVDDDTRPPSSSSPDQEQDVIDVQADPVGVKEDGTLPRHWEEALEPNKKGGGGRERRNAVDADADASTSSSSTTSSSTASQSLSSRLASLFRRAATGRDSALFVLKQAGRARILRRFYSRVREVNSLEPEVSALTDEGLRLEAAALRARALGDSSKNLKPEPLDALLPRAFALVREASRRTLGLRPYDVQLVGAMVLHEGLVAEMKTGEGKTLVAVLAAFLNALTGKGVLIVTVNDYLAKRDREWVGKPLELLGLTTAFVPDSLPHKKRSKPLSADVCWMTPQQLAFTYLHDNTTNLPGAAEVALRRPLHFAIVDEVDSVLIDECQTPMIISGGPLRGDEGKYEVAQQIFVGKREFTWELEKGEGGGGEEGWGGRLVRKEQKQKKGETKLSTSTSTSSSSSSTSSTSSSSFDFFSELAFREAPSDPVTGDILPGALGDFVFDRRKRSVALTTAGAAKAARRLVDAGQLPTPSSSSSSDDGPSSHHHSPSDIELGAALWQGEDPWGPYVNNALKANTIFTRDEQYILRKGEAKIVDAETGRVLPESRWTDGLHQAVEAKEGLRVRGASATQGQITFQSLFRKFEKLAGMSGTAVSVSEELHDVYRLGVIPVPPHRPTRRVDHPASMFFEGLAKQAQIACLLAGARKRGRPVLLGTKSVAESERLSRALESGLAAARLRFEKDYPWCVRGEVSMGEHEWEEREHVMENAFGKKMKVKGFRFVPKRIPHRLLNARPELVEEEAAIVAQAGLPGSITIATSMAGRGTDILLGGNARGLASARLLMDLGYLLGGEAAEVCRGAGGGERGRVAAKERQPKPSTAVAEAAARAEAAAAAAAEAGSSSSELVLTLESFGIDEQALAAVARVRAHLYACEGCELPKKKRKKKKEKEKEKKNGGAAATADDEDDDDDEDFSASMPLLSDEEASDPQRVRADRARAHIEAALLVAERVRAAFKLQQQKQEKEKGTRETTAHDKGRNDGGGGGKRNGGIGAYADARASFAVSGPAIAAFARSHPAVERLGDDATRRELVVAAAVLWTWFDEVCSRLASQVRDAGGLLVVVASVLDSQRVHDQLVGRCGRQGDPGETVVVVDVDDFAPELGGVFNRSSPDGGDASFSSPSNDNNPSSSRRGVDGLRAKVAEAEQAAQRNFARRFAERTGQGLLGGFGLLDLSVEGAIPAKVFRALRSRAEEDAGSVRRNVKAVDEVMGVFRDHVYALRRGLLTGGPATQRALLRGVLCSVAGDLASAATGGGRLPPEEWDVEALIREARRLERQGRKGLAHAKDAEGRTHKVVVEVLVAKGFVPGVSDPSLYPPAHYVEDLRATANDLRQPVRAWTPKAQVFGEGGGGGGDGDVGEERKVPSVTELAESLRGAAEVDAAEALRLGLGGGSTSGNGNGKGKGGNKQQVTSEAKRAFLLRPGSSLRGFSSLVGEFGGPGVIESRVEEEGEEEKTEDEEQEEKGRGRKTTTTTTTTRDRNLVAARALAVRVASELVRAASSTHPGLEYVLQVLYLLRGWGAADEVRFRNPTPVDVGAEVAREVLDARWGNFLADAGALEAAVALRVFSAQLDPLEEFRLEAGEMFVQLLRRYRRQVAAELLGGPEIVVHPTVEVEDEKDGAAPKGKKKQQQQQRLFLVDFVNPEDKRHAEEKAAVSAAGTAAAAAGAAADGGGDGDAEGEGGSGGGGG